MLNIGLNPVIRREGRLGMIVISQKVNLQGAKSFQLLVGGAVEDTKRLVDG